MATVYNPAHAEFPPYVIGPGYIKLKVISQETGHEIHFRVRMTTLLGKLKRGYANRLGHDLGNLRFLYDGQLLSDTDTPNQLKMVTDDVIAVYCLNWPSDSDGDEASSDEEQEVIKAPPG